LILIQKKTRPHRIGRFLPKSPTYCPRSHGAFFIAEYF